MTFNLAKYKFKLKLLFLNSVFILYLQIIGHLSRLQFGICWFFSPGYTNLTNLQPNKSINFTFTFTLTLMNCAFLYEKLNSLGLKSKPGLKPVYLMQPFVLCHTHINDNKNGEKRESRTGIHSVWPLT